MSRVVRDGFWSVGKPGASQIFAASLLVVNILAVGWEFCGDESPCLASSFRAQIRPDVKDRSPGDAV